MNTKRSREANHRQKNEKKAKIIQKCGYKVSFFAHFFTHTPHTHARTSTRRRRIWTKCDTREKMGAREISIYHRFHPLPRALRPASEACGRKKARNYNSHVRKSLSAPFFSSPHTLRSAMERRGGKWGGPQKIQLNVARSFTRFFFITHTPPRERRT